MPSPAVSKFTFKTVLRRFRRNRRGSAAVEFALVAPMFFALLFAILETGLMFFANQALESATQNAARAILTGQAQTGQLPSCGSCTPAQQFKNYVCPTASAISSLFDCSRLYVDVRSYSSSFASVTLSNHTDTACNFDATAMQYNPGGTGQVTVVQVYYQWPLFVTGLGYNIGCGTTNKRLLVATAAFQNEPY